MVRTLLQDSVLMESLFCGASLEPHDTRSDCCFPVRYATAIGGFKHEQSRLPAV